MTGKVPLHSQYFDQIPKAEIRDGNERGASFSFTPFSLPLANIVGIETISGRMWDHHRENLVPCCMLGVWHGLPEFPLPQHANVALSGMTTLRRLKGAIRFPGMLVPPERAVKILFLLGCHCTFYCRDLTLKA